MNQFGDTLTCQQGVVSICGWRYHSTEIKLTITATSVTLTAVGVGSDKVALTAKEFKKLREGTFVFSGKVGVHVATFDGSVTDKGERIAGSYTSTGSSNSDQNGPGTFVMKKD